MNALLTFASTDLRNIRRDSMLATMLLVPWLMVVLLRLLLPLLGDWMMARFQLDLATLQPLFLSLFFVLQIPMLFGLVFGLLVLDERDEGTLTALRVTPVSPNTYLIYRVGMSALLAAFYVALTLALSGLIPSARWGAILPIALLAGLFGPLVALLLAAFAKNKMEGLALAKLLGSLMLGPLAAYFLPSRWQLAVGILPSYWPAKALWVALAGNNPWPYLLVGLTWNVILLVGLVRVFRTKLYQ